MSIPFPRLNLPLVKLQIKKKLDKLYVFDVTRKKELLITPEEWVRQHIIHFLKNEYGYPFSLMSSEGGLNINSNIQRYDLLCYGNTGLPLVLVECKAPEIKLTQEVFDQAARYNYKLNVPYILITNGLEHYCCAVDVENKSYKFLTSVPSFKSLCS